MVDMWIKSTSQANMLIDLQNIGTWLVNTNTLIEASHNHAIHVFEINGIVHANIRCTQEVADAINGATFTNGTEVLPEPQFKKMMWA